MTIDPIKRVLADAKKVLADLVFNMSSHEGNPMTFPEVKTLVDGTTVGGHKISDADQVKNIDLGWQKLFSLVQANEFSVSREVILSIHALYAQNEALTWGEFRDSKVSISGTQYLPPDSNQLVNLFDEMAAEYESSSDKEDASYDLFLTCAATQFFHDGNTRAGQYLMNGARLSQGLPIITIPATKNLEYNTKMVRFYDTLDRSEMKIFLAGCRLLHEPVNQTE